MNGLDFLVKGGSLARLDVGSLVVGLIRFFAAEPTLSFAAADTSTAPSVTTTSTSCFFK